MSNQVIALYERLLHAWNDQDADAFGAVFADDGLFDELWPAVKRGWGVVEQLTRELTEVLRRGQVVDT